MPQNQKVYINLNDLLEIISQKIILYTLAHPQRPSRDDSLCISLIPVQ